MANLMQMLLVNKQRDEGQALVEYGLIMAVIAIAAIVAIGVTGGGVDGLYGTIQQVAKAMADRLA